MGIAGAGFGASKALEEILGEQMLRAQMAQRQREQEAQAAIQQQRLQQDITEGNARIEQGNKQIDLSERKRRDDNNARGLDFMRTDKADMDLESAVSTLPTHLKPIAGLMRAGVVGKLSPDDLETPEHRDAAAKAAEDREIRIRNASRAPQAPRDRKQAWVKRGGEIVPIEEGTAQRGDTPYDPVAARSSQPANQIEAQDTAREVQRIASALKDHDGFGGAFAGVIGSHVPTTRQSTADAEVLRDSLTSLLTLENMGKMKGVLSDSDMKLLRQASSTISPKMSAPAAKAELERIIQVMNKVAGNQVGQQQTDQTPLDEVRYERDPKTNRLVRVGG